ncbi:MAG: macrolide efflux MFS transporter Mef(B) [Chloroflexi bacterium HGW-Chloroflexi-10]|nr:MAG: macrolide efflux MFS transporter Mef(B) [Chloroflexi bacterium HGW-Chloroflexi-10]
MTNNSTSWRRPFFNLYIGQAFSLLSSSAVQFAIIWWITVETGSAIALTIASIVGLLPQVVIGLFAGVWIDRYNRKSIMIVADFAVATASLILGISFFFGKPSLFFVYFILFIRALGETFHKPALQAAIPQLVPESELTKAGGLGQMVSSICAMAGPMLGAFLMSITSMKYIMLVDIVGAILAVLLLCFVRIGKHSAVQGERPSIMEDMKQGFRAIRENKLLVKMSLPIFMISIVFMPLGSLLPLMVKNYFNGTAWHNGIIQTLFSVGMLLSALVIGLTGGLKKPILMISLSAILLGFCSLIGGVLPATAFWAFCIVVFVMGTTGMLGNIPYVAYIQQSIPPENLGKVISFVTSVMSLGIPLGMLIAGPVAEAVGVNNWMIIAGLLMFLVGFLSFALTRMTEINKNMVVN